MPAGNPAVIDALRSSLRLHWEAIEAAQATIEEIGLENYLAAFL